MAGAQADQAAECRGKADRAVGVGAERKIAQAARDGRRVCAPNGAGTGYCVFDDLGLPEADGLSAYCYYLEYGYLGYSWDLCPEGTRYTTNGAGTAFCLWEEVELPEAPDLQAYCYYVEDGYLGFHWTDTPATAGYQCPEGARQTDNGAGLSFCLFEDLWLPPGDDLQPYCDYLDDGYFGYSWSL